MSELVDELLNINSELENFIERIRQPEIWEPLKKLCGACEEVARAWSGSWIGYQANVYYADFQPPPPGDHFNALEGLEGSSRYWFEYDPDEVRNFIRNKAGNPNLDAAHVLEKEGSSLINDKRNEIISILETVPSFQQYDFLNSLKDDVKAKQAFTSSDFVKLHAPKQYMSLDMVAMLQGIQIPPHITVLAEVFSIKSRGNICKDLTDIAKRAASHIKRVEKSEEHFEMIRENVFIGHGNSPVWKDLKDFLQDRLHLQWDEFNRVPVAGITNSDRLSQMLDSAAIALLVMTGEDEQGDGKLTARMNVVHEAGLFQGRLGFTRAIILLEDGCEEFSNIEGLGQIRFPKGNIKAVSEEVRKVLEREGLMPTS